MILKRKINIINNFKYLLNKFIYINIYKYFIYRWYPPGHGDFYESFRNSGLLKKFIKEVKNF